ncbi:MAG: hypothetical protein Q4A31_01870 [Corynebacterium sp.]|uniref:hypothetical protein n=1 Tax=Corynebacterium sp. TaxID=1720 RepID=UPI0026DAF3F1|nr:hypothetical protein [Corynebacterium sp.]MDO4760653.1 hypothetical protein [Corynebacterium sp.]
MEYYDYTLFDVTKEAGSRLEALYSHLSLTSATDAESRWWRLKIAALKGFPTFIHFTHSDQMRSAIALINTEVEFLTSAYEQQLHLIWNKENEQQLRAQESARRAPQEFYGLSVDPALVAELEQYAQQLRTVYTQLAISAPSTMDERWWMMKLSEMAHFPFGIGISSNDMCQALIALIKVEKDFLAHAYYTQLAVLSDSIVSTLAQQRATQKFPKQRS